MRSSIKVAKPITPKITTSFLVFRTRHLEIAIDYKTNGYYCLNYSSYHIISGLGWIDTIVSLIILKVNGLSGYALATASGSTFSLMSENE